MSVSFWLLTPRQGTGGGGINMLANLIISDIVCLRERGLFMKILLAAIMVGTGIGPFVVGVIVQNISWRWVFLLNLPVSGLELALVLVFPEANYGRESAVVEKLKRIDFVSNTIFVASVVAILMALTYSGTIYLWSSWKVIFPLVVGTLDLGLFFLYEPSMCCLEPTIPPCLFKNRTTAAAFALTFLYSILLYWLLYYLQLYFQGVYGSTPSRSGVQLLPTVFIMISFAAVSGKLLTKFGRYRPFQIGGFGLATVRIGYMTLLKNDSLTAVWVYFQGLIATGLGLVSSATLPTVLAPLKEDAATATGTWVFLRSFGIIWGVTLPSIVFNNQFDHLSRRINDSATRDSCSNGHACGHAAGLFIEPYHGALRDQIISVFSDNPKAVWQVAIGAAGLGFLVVFIEWEIKLQAVLKTDFGISEKEPEPGELAEP
jgi:MFS family permease